MEGGDEEPLPFRVTEETGEDGQGSDPLSDADLVSDEELEVVSTDNSPVAQ
jgi:hypothetical protein